MAFKMKPSGVKKCSYSGMKKKGLLNDSPSTNDGNTMAYQTFDPEEAKKKVEETAEEKAKGSISQANLYGQKTGKAATERDIDYAKKKKAAELVFTTRMKESGLSLDEYKKTAEGGKLSTDIQTVASQSLGY